jgi:hypothetical protein
LQAARAYAAAALAAFTAAALRSDPLDVLEPPSDGDDWDEQRLAPQPETGIHAVDAEAKKLHAEAVGAPLPRSGPAPKRRSRYAALAAPKQELPGSKLAALAEFLRGHTTSGILVRRLHPTQPADRPPAHAPRRSPGHDPDRYHPGPGRATPRGAAGSRRAPSTVAQAQNPRCSSKVRSRRFPVPGSSAQVRPVVWVFDGSYYLPLR